MANIFQRFGDIIKANINELLDKAEDPAKMVDQCLRDAMEDLAEVKNQTAEVMAEETRCERNVKELKAEIDKLDAVARKALQAHNEGDARVILEKKTALQVQLVTAENTYGIAKANADKMRQMHDKLVSDIELLNTKKENIKAQMSMAKAQEAVNKASASANVQSSIDKFSRYEQAAQKRLDKAVAESELNAGPEDSADAIIAKYGDGTTSSVDDELARLKAEMGIE